MSALSEDEKLCHKFDIAYFVAIEKLSFRKYPQICELEARHGVNFLGPVIQMTRMLAPLSTI